MALAKRLWDSQDFRRFLAIVLGVFLGNFILAYGWGFFLTDDMLPMDASAAVRIRNIANLETTDVGDARILTFDGGGQYGYASYVRHPLLPLYKRTDAMLDYQPIATDEDVVVQDFTHTYLLGLRQSELAAVYSVDTSSLGFDWTRFFIMVVSMAMMWFLYNRFMGLKNQSDSNV